MHYLCKAKRQTPFATNLSLMNKTFNELNAELNAKLTSVNSMNITAEARDHQKVTLMIAYIAMMKEAK